MKKNLFYLFALICSMSLFTACSDDDEKVKDPIVGTWKVLPVETDDTDAVIGGALSLIWDAPEGTTLSFLPVSSVADLGNQLGSVLIPQVLRDITFGEDESIVATYSSAGVDLSGENPIAPVWEKSPADYVSYKLQGNGKMLLFLNLDKILNDANTKSDMSAFSDLLAMVENGIPLNYEVSADENNLKVYIDKALMTRIAAAAPALAGLIPDDPDALGSFGPMVKMILQDLPGVMEKTTKFELALKFKK